MFGLLLKAFSRRSTILAAVLAVLSLIAVDSQAVFWPKYLNAELGWTPDNLVNLDGLAVWFGLGGSLAGGAVASAIGAKRSVLLGLGGTAVCWLAYYLTRDYWASRTVVTVLSLAVTTFVGFAQVSMFALFMGICWTPIAATQFTAFMAMMNVSKALGAHFAGTIEKAFAHSMPQAHLALAALQLVLVGVVLGIKPEQEREELRQEEE